MNPWWYTFFSSKSLFLFNPLYLFHLFELMFLISPNIRPPRAARLLHVSEEHGSEGPTQRGLVPWLTFQLPSVTYPIEKSEKLSADPALLEPSRAAAGTTFGVELFLACMSLSPPVSLAPPPAVPETARLFPCLHVSLATSVFRPASGSAWDCTPFSEARAWYLQTLPKPCRASATPPEGWSRQLTALVALLFLRPSETAVWHPQTLPTLPKPRSASETAAAPPRVFYTFRNCCLAPPNPSNPSKTSQCLRHCCSASKSLLWPSETAVWHPQTLPTLPTLPKPRSASETAAAPPRVFYDLPKLLFGTPKPFQPFQRFQNLAEPQRLLQRLRKSFMTFRNCCLAPPNPSNPSNPSKTSQRLRDCYSASKSLLWPFETAVWHPQTLPTLPTLPKPRSASETAAAPPRVFYDLPKLLFGTPKPFQPFQPFQNLAAPPRVFYDLPKLLFGTPKPFQPFQRFQNLATPQRLLQRLQESFMTFRNCCLAPPNPSNPSKTSQRLRDCCSTSKSLLWPSETVVWHPQTLPTLPTLPQPRSASETAAAPPRVFYDLPKLLFGTPKPFQPFQNLAAPQRLLQRLQESFMTFRNCCLAPPNPSNPSKTSQRLRDCWSASESLLRPSETAVWHPKPFQPFQRFQNLAAPQRLLQRLRKSFMTFRNCCLAPPNPSNPSNPSETSQRLRDCCSASKSLLWPSETAVWHPQTLPTLPKPRSASETDMDCSTD